LLAQIDESRSTEIAKRLGVSIQLMSQTMNRLETVVVEREKTQKGIISTFIEEFRRAGDPRTESWQERLLKATIELKVAMIGTTSQLRIAWQRTLLQHPSFRAMLMFGQTMKTVITAPWKMLFGARGGYLSDVRRATRTDNVYMKMVNLLSILYTKGMPKLDSIALYTKASAEAAIGREIKPGTALTYTWFDKIREAMTSRSIVSAGSSSFDSFVDALGLDKRALRDAGIEDWRGFFRPGLVMRRMGVTRENIGDITEEATQRGKDVLSCLLELVKLKRDQEEREGPHSPSMAQNIAATAKTTYANFKDRVKTEKKKLWTLDRIKKSAKEQVSKLGGLKGFFKKMGKKVWSWIPIIFNLIRSIVSPIWKIAKWIGMALGTGIGSIGTGIAGTIGGVAAGGSSALAAGGVGGLAKWGVGGGMKLAGRAAAGAGGLLIGGVMTIGDAIRAIRDPEGFVGGIFARGISGFLGGSDSGVKGTTRGAMKGGAIGAGIGSFVPGIGTLIGGAFGALAGGILGFVGGKNISKYVSQAFKDVKEIISIIWKVVKFPFDFMQEGIKSFWILTKFLYRKLDAFLSTPGFIGDIWQALKNVIGTIMKIYRWLREKIDSTITKIPVIGKIYTKFKEVTKDISSGTLASKLEKSLSDVEGKPVPKPMKHPENLVKGVIDAKQKGLDYINSLTSSAAKEKASEKRIAEKAAEKSAEKVVEKLEETGKNQTKAIAISTNNLVSSNSSLINNSSVNTGGSGSSPGFSSGNRSAEKVTFNKMN